MLNMPNYKFLFIIKTLYENYDEFNKNNLYFVVRKYFNEEENLLLISNVIISIKELKFTKEEIGQMINVKTKLMTEEELNKTEEELQKNKIKKKLI